MATRENPNIQGQEPTHCPYCHTPNPVSYKYDPLRNISGCDHCYREWLTDCSWAIDFLPEYEPGYVSPLQKEMDESLDKMNQTLDKMNVLLDQKVV